MTIILDRVLERAKREQEWGTPAILDAALAVAEADPEQGARLAGFLQDRPHSQIKPGIIPKISDQPWSKDLFSQWQNSGVVGPVKKAISTERKKKADGNV